MLNNETAAGLQPAAILAPKVGSSQNTFQVSISDLNYNINSNPYAGPYYLARLLVNLPVEEASLLTLGLPWQTLALGVMNCQGQERVSKFEELIQSTAQGETIRQAVFSMDPLAPLPEPQQSAKINSDFPRLPREIHEPKSWQSYESGKWLQDYVNFACQAAPMSDPAFHLSAGLFLLSTAVARRVCLQVGIQRIYPSLYQLIVAESTLYHKTSALMIAQALLKEAGLDILLLASRQTPESLVAELGTMRPSTFESWSENEKKRWIAERSFSAQRGWLLDEASHLLDSFNRDYTAGLLPLVLALFDCPEREVSQTVGRGRQVVQYAYLSFLGATTPSAVAEHIQRNAHWSNGLWARFAMVTPQKDIPDWHFFPTDVKIPPGLSSQLNRLAFKALPVPNVKETAGDVQVEPPPALQVILDADVYPAWEAYAKGIGYDLLLEGSVDRRLYPSYGRLYIAAMKVAILLASIDWADQPERGKSPRVRLSHWYQGQAIAETWRESVHRMLNDFAAGEEHNQEQNLLRILRRSSLEGMTAREIGQMAHIKREIVETQLLVMEQDGLVERVQNNGRRAITYRYPVKV
jgi:hypothetical protein